SQDVADALTMAVACAVSYWMESQVLISVTNSHSAVLGGMWAAISVVFVFRATRESTWSAGVARLIATSVSVVLCLLYLWFFPFTVAGMAALIGLGTLAMMLLGRRDGIITTGITTVVIVVVAAP
ncbi:MAG TPA: FUSC family protein, partial [Pseudolabrys sp.]|nr:FUSC family protein [Pseudolabrys sp.]